MRPARSRYRIAVAGSLLVHAGVAALIFLAFAGSREPTVAVVEGVELVGVEPEGAAVPKGRVPVAAQLKTTRAGVSADTNPAPGAGALPGASQGTAPGASASSEMPGPPAHASAVGSYLALVREKLSREIRAPRERGPFSTRVLRITLEMTLGSDGAVKNSAIRESSGSPDFDRSVTEALRRASPFPPFSPAMGDLREVTLRLPVEIRFHD